jgi:hypothetical protein
LQDAFEYDPEAIAAFRVSVSEARFSTYLAAAGGDPAKAMQLYYWNSFLSQAMYLPLQMWEVALRNKLNAFLDWKYGAKWPYDERLLRSLKASEQKKLNETKTRLTPSAAKGLASTDKIVADLSAGFWVSLLTKSYDIPFSWRYNLARIFPNLPQPDRAAIAAQCDGLLKLRNRVEHHEPVFHLNLPVLRQDLAALTTGMCSSVAAYVGVACTFEAIWSKRP